MIRARDCYDTFTLSAKDHQGNSYTFRVLMSRSPTLILRDMIRSARRILRITPTRIRSIERRRLCR